MCSFYRFILPRWDHEPIDNPGSVSRPLGYSQLPVTPILCDLTPYGLVGYLYTCDTYKLTKLMTF